MCVLKRFNFNNSIEQEFDDIYHKKTSPKGMFRKNMLDASPTSIMAASTYIAGRMSRLYYLLGLLVLKDFFQICML